MDTTKRKDDLPAGIPGRFPHIAIRDIDGRPEPYIRDSGLAVWEVAWLARAYDGNAEAIARHTLADSGLIGEGLRYAAEHPDEIDAQIARHTEHSEEELRKLLPGMQVVAVEGSESDGHPA